MLKLIFKSLWHHRIQNAAVMFSIAIGVCLAFSVLLIQDGVSQGMEIAKQRLGADVLVVPGDASIEPGQILYGASPSNIYMPKNMESKVAAIAGVHKVTAQFFTQTVTEACCDIGEAIRLIGYDAKTDWIIEPWVKNIKQAELADNDIIVGVNVPLFSTDMINILGKSFHVAAIMEQTGTGLDKSIFMNIDTARQLAVESPQLASVWNEHNQAPNLISSILVEIDGSADIKKIHSDIQKLGNVQVFSAAETKQHIYDQLATIVGLLTIVGILAVLTSIFQLFARMYALTLERQGEWGLYIALGSTWADIAKMILAEVGFLAVGGAVTGFLFGYILFVWSIGFMEAQQAFPFLYPKLGTTFEIAFFIFVVLLFISSMAAVIPAYRSRSIQPSEIMTRGEFY